MKSPENVATRARTVRPETDRQPESRALKDGTPMGPGASKRSDRHADLAEVPAGLLVAERLRQARERKRLGDDGADAGRLESADHVDLVRASAHDDALELDLLGHEQHRRHLALEARENADQRDVPPESHGLN